LRLRVREPPLRNSSRTLGSASDSSFPIQGSFTAPSRRCRFGQPLIDVVIGAARVAVNTPVDAIREWRLHPSLVDAAEGEPNGRSEIPCLPPKRTSRARTHVARPNAGNVRRIQ